MRLHLITKPRRTEKAPRFILANGTLACASVVFGIVAIGGWFLAYQSVSLYLALFLSAMSLISALVVPTTAGAFDTAKGFAKVRLALVIAVFMVIDWAGVHQGYVTIEKMATEKSYAQEIERWDAEKVSAQDRINAAQAKIDALPTSQVACEGYGPQNCATRLAGLEADRATFVAERDAARADLAAVGAQPVRPELFPHWIVSIVAAAIQIVLFIGFGALAETTRKERERLRTERKDAEVRRSRKRNRGKPQLHAVP
jgi:hypothetical protein